MFRFVSIVLVAAICAAGYFFYTSSSPSATQEIPPVAIQTNDSPQPIKEPAPSVDSSRAPALPVLSEEQQQQAKEHVASITTAPEKPLDIKSADHFVTAEQVLDLPELQAEIIKIETIDSPQDDNSQQKVDVIVAAPKQANSQQSVAQTNQNNAQAAQSFAVKIPSFKKTVIPQPNEVSEPITLTTSSKATTEVTQDSQQAPVAVVSTSAEVTKAPPVNTAPIKVLTTVTGETTSIKTIPVKIAPVKVTPVIVENTATVTDNLEAQSTIINTLKKNLAEISDIKVSELTSLVTEKPSAEPKPTVAQAVTKQKPATIINAEPSNAKQPAVLTNSTNKVSSKIEKPNTPTKVVVKSNDAQPTASTTASTVRTQSEKNRIKLKELLSNTDSDEKRIFYLHAVNPDDEQGIWGIIQKGLTGTFSKGINLTQANGTVRTLIPEDADEILSNKNSSFLGKLLNYKVLTTYVYNYEKGNIGKNPDYIKPGQQLIIVTFTEQELMGIYQHFKDFRAQE